MRRTTVAAIAVAIGVTVSGTAAWAQPAPPRQQSDQTDTRPMTPPSGGPPGQMGMGQMGMGQMGGSGPNGQGPMGMHHPGMHRHPPGAELFGLFYRPDDRKLTPADVQKIAEAIPLWFGTRTWKVTEVASNPDGTIKFAYATADGAVIARFTMDSKTGQVKRVG